MQLFELLGKIVIDATSANQAIDGTVSNAEGASNKMQGSFNKVGGLLKGALLGAAGAAAGAITALGIAGIKGAGELEAATGRMRAALGLTEAEATRMGGVVTDLYRNGVGGSITEAASKVTVLRQALGAMSDEQTSKLTSMAATIEDVYGADYASTVQAAKTLTDQFGLSNQQAFDFVATGFQKGLNSSGDFLESVTEYGTQFANGGASASEFFSVMESGMQGGVLGTDKAADAFKEFRLRIQDGSDLTKDSLAQLGISSDDLAAKISSGQTTAAQAFQLVIAKLGETEDPMIRMQAGAGLIGSQFEDLGDKAVTSLSLTSTSLEDMTGATDRAADAAYNNLSSAWTTFMRTLQTVSTEVIGPFVPQLTQLLGVMTEKAPLMIDAAKSVSTYLKQWSPEIQGFISDVGEVASDVFSIMAALWTNVLKPSWTAIGPFVSGLFSGIGDVLKGFKLLLEGDLTGAVTAFSNGILTAWSGLTASVQAIFNGLWSAVKTPLEQLVTNTVNALLGIPAQIADVGKQIIDGLVGGIQDNLSAAKDSVTNFAGNIGSWFKNALGIQSPSTVFAGFGANISEGLIQGIQSKLAAARDTITSFAGKVGGWFKSTLGINSPSTVFMGYGGNILDGLLIGLQQRFPGVMAFFQQLGAQISAIGSGLSLGGGQGGGGGGLVGSLGQAFTWVSTNLTTFGNQLLSNVTGLYNEGVARQTARNQETAAALAHQSWIQSVWQSTTSWVSGALTSAVSWVGTTLTSIGGFVWSTLSQLGSSLLNLAGSQIPWLGDSMAAMAGGPIAMLVAFLTSLIGETWQFQAVIGEAIKIVQPLIAILGDLISAIWPLIEVIFSYLKTGFEALGWVLKTIVTPVFTFVAKAIATVWNAIARAINWALGWLGVHVNEVNVNASAPASYNPIFKNAFNGYQGQQNKQRSSTGSSKPAPAKQPKSPTYKAPKQTAPKAPRATAPKAPKSPSAPKSPGIGKTPVGTTPGTGTGTDVGRGSGGTKVSEITGPTRDMFLDIFEPLVTLPSLIGIGERILATLQAGLGVAPNFAVNVGSAGGDVINHFNINMNATGDLKYDARQLAKEITPHLATAFKNGKRGTGGK